MKVVLVSDGGEYKKNKKLAVLATLRPKSALIIIYFILMMFDNETK